MIPITVLFDGGYVRASPHGPSRYSSVIPSYPKVVTREPYRTPHSATIVPQQWVREPCRRNSSRGASAFLAWALLACLLPTSLTPRRLCSPRACFPKQALDFVVTDGVRYDTGPEGAFYHAIVTHVREADKAGNIITYRQEADGTLTKTGVIERVDPQASPLIRETGVILMERKGERSAFRPCSLQYCYRTYCCTAAAHVLLLV